MLRASDIEIFVPAPGSGLAVDVEPGAAIVGVRRPRHDGLISIAVENAPVIGAYSEPFADRVERALGKLRSVRFGIRPRLVAGEELVSVARFDPRGAEVHPVRGGRELLAGWVGIAHLDASELRATSSVRREIRTALEREKQEREAASPARPSSERDPLGSRLN